MKLRNNLTYAVIPAKAGIYWRKSAWWIRFLPSQECQMLIN